MGQEPAHSRFNWAGLSAGKSAALRRLTVLRVLAGFNWAGLSAGKSGTL